MIVTEIRAEIEGYLRLGLRHVRRHRDAPRSTTLGCTDPDLPWLLGLYAHRYGVIYWIPRHEALALSTTVTTHARDIDAAGEYLAQTGTGNALFNLAVSCYVRATRRRSVTRDRYVPASGFQPTQADTLTHLASDFLDVNPECAMVRAPARYDLHDFAHLTAARLCPTLYRNHFGADFDQMPRHVVDLVAGFTAPEQPPHADGVVFSDILTPLFADAPWPALPEPAVVDWLAAQITGYLLAESTPPGVNVGVPTRPVHPIELAMLVQNKAYELPASEIERQVFVRGGHDGHDDLADLTPSQRLRAIAVLTGRTWNEARNVLKHRAHRQAYRDVLSRLLRDEDWAKPIHNLLCACLASVDFEDYRQGGRMNLFQLAADLLAWAPGVNSYLPGR